MNSTTGTAYLTISGRVQGVWYRDFTRKHATALGLSGWVKNNTDGTVGACIEGRRDDIEKLIEILKEGPYLASVKGIDVTWASERTDLNGFEIRYS